MTLYSYCIPVDSGAAPNPFWGICTLAICKPIIRRNAKSGDWIAAMGSSNLGLAGRLVYAMEVTKVLSFSEYDAYCQQYLRNKLPDVKNKDPRRWVGDCIYAFKNGQPKLRPSVHGMENVTRDLRGNNVLLSDNFYYFGSEPQDLPNDLLKIVRQGRGHKSISNEACRDRFIHWISEFTEMKNKVNAMPYGLIHNKTLEEMAECRNRHCIEDEADEEIGHEDC